MIFGQGNTPRPQHQTSFSTHGIPNKTHPRETHGRDEHHSESESETWHARTRAKSHPRTRTQSQSQSQSRTQSRAYMILGITRICLMFVGVAAALFIIHHQLQIIHFRTCRANLLAVVLHQRSDVCYGMELTISMIERGYQHGIAAIMQLGVSSSALFLPYLISIVRAWTSSDVKRTPTSQSSSWWPFSPSPKKRRLSVTKLISWQQTKV